MWVGAQRLARPLRPPGKIRYPLYREAGWAARPVWTGAENLIPIGIRSPDRPARSESLYRLSYPGPQANLFHDKFVHMDEQTLQSTNAILQLATARSTKEEPY